MVLKPLNNDDIETSGSDPMGFIRPFYQGFRHIFIRLLSTTFRQMEYKLAMSILDPKLNFSDLVDPTLSSSNGFLISDPHLMMRLEAYVNNLANYEKVMCHQCLIYFCCV
ncbi:RNA cytidine acetyltransferase 2-like [Olea europaea var. sylvestris]|uniref:RNA cytidine acetyltransferase 2-like n=1 Tax=Olea europaea var. sylvestris TaxID=158386 RepID=UPI000C1D7D01|nr:RNA cytidine acetyltransferase 2-like [Olea europaea var. sylvestris]